MKCFLCKNSRLAIKKIINDVFILECQKCKIAFTNIKKINKIKLKEIYNFNHYKSLKKRLNNRIELLIKIIKKFKKQGIVLDIGAGYGLFTSILLKKGKYKATIIEPSLPLKYLQKQKIIYYKCKIEQFFKINKEKYDLIFLLDVLEHFKNPIFNLKKIKNNLKDDGFIVIQVPNYQSFMAKICSNWSWWMVEDHKFHFSPKSIKLLLKKTGYKINFFMTYEDIYDFKKNLDGNFVKIKSLFLRKFIKLFFYPIFFPTYFIFRYIFWFFGFGGLIFLIAKKDDNKNLSII